MSRLVVPVQPLSGESLAGLIARAAERNGYHRAGMVLEIAGLSPLRPESVGSRPIETAESLALALGTDVDALKPLYHSALDQTYVDFFGVPIRIVLREASRRRVSPRALKVSPHHRAIWQIRPFSFDPATREMLLDRCPVCNNLLGFVRTQGICFCDHCSQAGELGYGIEPSVDLRDFPQPLVEVADIEALDFVSSLVDPEANSSAYHSVSDDLASLSRGELFEMALSLGTAWKLNDDNIQLDPEHLVSSRYDVLSPDSLAKAGRALLNWPNGFIAFCTEAAENAGQRDGDFSRNKELGALANLQLGPMLSQRAKIALQEAEHKFRKKSESQMSFLRKGAQRQGWEWITSTELMEKFLCNAKLLHRIREHPKVRTRFQDDNPRAPVLFDFLQTYKVLKESLEIIGPSECSVKLGIPLHAVDELQQRGYLSKVSSIAADVSGYEDPYSERELERLVRKLIRDENNIDLVPGPTDQGFITVSEFMLRYPAGWKPWAPLIEAMVTGMVEVRLHRMPTKGLMSAISIRGGEAVYEALSQGLDRYSEPSGAVPMTSAAMMMGITKYDQLTALVRQGILTLDESKLLPVDQVLEFSRVYILQGEIGARAGIRGLSVVGWTQDRGLSPSMDLGVNSGRVFLRRDVEPYLDLQPWNGKPGLDLTLPNRLHRTWRSAKHFPQFEGYPRALKNQKPSFEGHLSYYERRKLRAAKST